MRTTVSKKNKYWISRHRYLELSHFCAQYNEWIKIRKDLEGLQRAVVAKYIVKCATNGYSYDKLRAKEKIPCCRQVFYEVYRCFFWHLSNARK